MRARRNVPMIDWWRLLADLRGAGHHLKAVAASLSVPRQTVSAWQYGAEPSHSDGERLIEHWAEITGRHREDAPKRMRYAQSGAR